MDAYDESNDIAHFMSVYVSWMTEPSDDSAWVEMSEEDAGSEFMAFLDRVQGIAWDAGYKAGQGSMLRSAGGEPLTNPYRSTE